jgi:succinate dehydrogenase/fumarate reductase flavoprotein subunit
MTLQAANDRNDPVMIDTYRRLKTLRSSFESLVDTVNQIGNSEKTVRDYETRIDQEKNRVSSYNFEGIQNDLEAIMKENAGLLAQVKKLSK